MATDRAHDDAPTVATGGREHGHGGVSVRFELLDNIAALEALRRPWRDLVDASAHDTPYLLPEFMLPWLRRLGDACAVCFVAAWEGEELVALAPMVQRRIGRFGIGLNLRGFPEVAPSPPCDLLVSPHAIGTIDLLLHRWLSRADWDLLELANAPEHSPAVTRLTERALETGLHVTRAAAPDIYEVVVRDSWAHYHASRTKNMRRNLRRGLRRCESLGQVSFPRYPEDLSIEEAVRQVFGVVSHSWKDHEEGPRGWNAFLRDLMGELDRAGLLRVNFLCIDGEAIAYLLDVPFKGSVFALHNGYDLRHQTANAGELLLMRSIERAHGDGTRAYVTGVRDYLHRWAADARRYQRVRIVRRGAIRALKLAAYDRLHERRAQRWLVQVEEAKAALKRRHRDSAGAPGA